MGVSIGVASYKGGVGKTTLVANLGCAMADYYRKNTIIVDADMHLANLSMQFNLIPNAGIQDVLEKKRKVDDVVVPLGGSLWILPAKHLYFKEVNVTEVKKVVQMLTSRYDVVLIDIPPGADIKPMRFLGACDMWIGVTTPDIHGVSGLMWVTSIAKKFGVKLMGVVVNRVLGRRYELPIPKIQEKLKMTVLGTVSEDEDVRIAMSDQVPLLREYKRSMAGDEILKIAKRLHAMIYPERG